MKTLFLTENLISMYQTFKIKEKYGESIKLILSTVHRIGRMKLNILTTSMQSIRLLFFNNFFDPVKLKFFFLLETVPYEFILKKVF